MTSDLKHIAVFPGKGHRNWNLLARILSKGDKSVVYKITEIGRYLSDSYNTKMKHHSQVFFLEDDFKSLMFKQLFTFN